MTRRKVIDKRVLAPDAKYGNFIVSQLVNYVMSHGKKVKAEQIVYFSIKIASKKCCKDPIEFFETLIDNLKPRYEVKSRRIGGSTYQVPIEVRSKRAVSLALKWLVSFAKKRSTEKGMFQKLAGEMCDVFNKRGASIKKLEDTHKMAEANQAFSHYRW
jgi:small subunit ribosomal protein S7